MMTPTEPTSVAVAGDWHGNASWAIKCIRHLAEHTDVTLLLHLGDFGYMGEGFDRYIHKVSREAAKAGVTIWVLPGNHENYDWLAKQPIDNQGRTITSPGILALPRGNRFTVAGVTFCAVGGAVSVDKGSRTFGRSWWPQEEITETEMNTISAGPPVDVLLTHDAPMGCATPRMDRRSFLDWVGPVVASEADAHQTRVRNIVDALHPRLLLHGHMHARYSETVEWVTPDYKPYACRIEGLACDDMEGNQILLDLTDPTNLTVTDLTPPLSKGPRFRDD